MAEIHAIEASTDNFQKLQTNVRGTSIAAYKTAVGDITEKEALSLQIVNSLDNHIQVPGKDYSHLKARGHELVDCVRLDDFCQAQGIGYVDYVKIDVEGFEMPVLRGAESLLGGKNIRFIELELGISTRNKFHTPFLEAYNYLVRYGYEVMGFYQQTRDFVENTPNIRRADVLFVNVADSKRFAW